MLQFASVTWITLEICYCNFFVRHFVVECFLSIVFVFCFLNFSSATRNRRGLHVSKRAKWFDCKDDEHDADTKPSKLLLVLVSFVCFQWWFSYFYPLSPLERLLLFTNPPLPASMSRFCYHVLRPSQSWPFSLPRPPILWAAYSMVLVFALDVSNTSQRFSRPSGLRWTCRSRLGKFSIPPAYSCIRIFYWSLKSSQMVGVVRIKLFLGSLFSKLFFADIWRKTVSFALLRSVRSVPGDRHLRVPPQCMVSQYDPPARSSLLNG